MPNSLAVRATIKFFYWAFKFSNPDKALWVCLSRAIRHGKIRSCITIMIIMIDN